MVVNLPTELLRSFTAIVDTGSMLRATQRVFVTQSALSLQMKRLEDLVQTALFQREGRRLKLTPAGHSLLGHAREILDANDRALQALSGDVLAGPARIGFVQDFAETLLSGVLARFTQLNPETQV
jgi:DNA-binding transcriptional LysR family regulator